MNIDMVNYEIPCRASYILRTKTQFLPGFDMRGE